MILPSDIELIIFDMDGTIIPSLEIVYEGIQHVCNEYGWPLKHSPQDINRYIGNASGELWKAIIPQEEANRWQELRDRVRQEYPRLFREHPLMYPGVKETLERLRQRGYTLVQYSNASVTYFDIVLSALGIREYYDYTECVHENGLTKTDLIAKIRQKFGDPGTAVVGDRIHDIEAAGENGCLSIGALYGYGVEEPRQADITIDTFRDLLNIFDRRIPVFERIEKEIRSRKQPECPLIVGVNGIDCSGKTVFAGSLEDYLKRRGFDVQLIHLDEFLNQSTVRYSGDYHDDLFYQRVKLGYQYNYVRLTDTLLKPLRQCGQVRTRLDLLDWKTDRYNISREFNITPETIVIIEGIFLFIENIAPFIDLQVFLEVPFDEALRRARQRDPEHIQNNYETKYQPAQRAYLAEFPPLENADIVIDNANPLRPEIT